MPKPYQIDRAGEIGLVDPRDVRPSQMPPQAWSLVRNARMSEGSVLAVPGYTRDVDIGDPTIHALAYYASAAGRHKIIYGDRYIYTLSSGNVQTTVKDMGADAGVYPTQLWITDEFNTIPIATNNLGSPQCQYAGGSQISNTTPFVPFPDWDTGGTYEGAQCLGVVAYGNFIVAYNIVDNGNFPNLVAWSDLAEPGLMPATWAYDGSGGSLGGRRVIGAGDGAILCAKVQRGNVMLYCERGTHRLTFVPGSEFVMDNDRVFDNFGAFGPRSVGSYGAQHQVVTKDDVMRHDGQQAVSVAEERVRTRAFESLTEEDTNRLFVEPYLRNSEMWVGAPNGDNQILLALTWRWAGPGMPWAVRDLPDIRHMAEVPILETDVIDDSWDTGPDEEWDTGRDIIWDYGSTIGDLQLQGVGADGWLYTLDEAAQTAISAVERTGINLLVDGALETITALVPRIESELPVTIEIGSSLTVEGPVKWQPPATFNPLTDHHVTRLSTGRRHAVRFTGQGFRLDGYDIEWEFHGES